MKVKPLHDWTIIKRHAPKAISTGGIIIPDSARDIPTEGTVVAIGPGRYKKDPGKKEKYIPTTLKPGQKVYFMEYALMEIEMDGTEVIFIREEDILGTLEEDKQLMVKTSHPLESKREQPLMARATGAPPTLVPPSEKEAPQKKQPVKKKPAEKKNLGTKEKAITKTRKRATKTTAKVKKTSIKKKTTKPAQKGASKKTAKKPTQRLLKKKTAAVTKKKTKTAAKSVKRVARKSVKGKKASPKKKTVTVSRKKKR